MNKISTRFSTIPSENWKLLQRDGARHSSGRLDCDKHLSNIARCKWFADCFRHSINSLVLWVLSFAMNLSTSFYFILFIIIDSKAFTFTFAFAFSMIVLPLCQLWAIEVCLSLIWSNLYRLFTHIWRHIRANRKKTVIKSCHIIITIHYWLRIRISLMQNKPNTINKR